MEMLNQRQATKKKLIERCLTGEISTLDAAILTGLTRRAIQKNLAQYKLYGDKAFIHGNTGKTKQTEKYKKLELIITEIFCNTCIDGKNPFKSVTYQFFTEILNEYYDITVSVNFVKKILKKLNHTSPVRHRCKKVTHIIFCDLEKNQLVNLFRPMARSMIGSWMVADMLFKVSLTMLQVILSGCT